MAEITKEKIKEMTKKYNRQKPSNPLTRDRERVGLTEDAKKFICNNSIPCNTGGRSTSQSPMPLGVASPPESNEIGGKMGKGKGG